jgi:hypothetical protein
MSYVTTTDPVSSARAAIHTSLIGRGVPDLLSTKLLGVLLELGQIGFRPNAAEIFEIASLAARLPGFHPERGFQDFL